MANQAPYNLTNLTTSENIPDIMSFFVTDVGFPIGEILTFMVFVIAFAILFQRSNEMLDALTGALFISWFTSLLMWFMGIMSSQFAIGTTILLGTVIVLSYAGDRRR